MKKILCTLLVLFCFCNSAFALEELIDFTNVTQSQKYLSNIGFKILNSNRIDKRIVFYYNYEDRDINAFARNIDKAVVVDKGITPFLDTDDEYAAILCHEIAHQIDFYEGGSFITLLMALSPKKYEIKADKRAVDYMVKAGFNPLALIVVMNKSFGQWAYESATHPVTSRRMAYLYEYIYTKYPEYLANNEYKNNVYYQNFLLTSRENRLKFQQKIENPSMKNKKINYK